MNKNIIKKQIRRPLKVQNTKTSNDPISPPSNGNQKRFGLKNVRKNKICNTFNKNLNKNKKMINFNRNMLKVKTKTKHSF